MNPIPQVIAAILISLLILRACKQFRFAEIMSCLLIKHHEQIKTGRNNRSFILYN